jgi:hypothetical protein
MVWLRQVAVMATSPAAMSRNANNVIALAKKFSNPPLFGWAVWVEDVSSEVITSLE